MSEQADSNDSKTPAARPKTNWIAILTLLCLVVVLAAFVLPPRLADRARPTVARVQIASLGTALEAFKFDNGYFPPGTNDLIDLMQQPPDATNWHGPYLFASVPLDPWGHPYLYECPGRHNPHGYDLSATGPDGNPIGNWKQR
jgi:general secretion pathway protein G